MLKKIQPFILAALTAAGIGMNGCAAKRIETSQIPQPPAPNGTAATAPAEMIPAARYVVEKRDTLWSISGRPLAYGDSFDWPLIFKANRDQIKDPDLIYPRQVFRIEKGVSEDDQTRARKLALETPRYQPHTKPRSALPVDYF